MSEADRRTDATTVAADARIGFIGLGLMGLPMSRNLLRAGFDLTVYNRTPGKGAALSGEGARVAASPVALADECTVVLACLSTVEASEETWLGPQGAITRARPRQLFVDHGTIGPNAARRFAAAARERGAEFVDAPVSGGPEGAAAATLAIMAGGSEAAFLRARPLFDAIGKHIYHMGGPGAGSVTKLINQILTLVHGAVAAEAIALGARAGAEPAQLLAVLRHSFGQSRVLERNGARILERDFAPGATLRLFAKDLTLARELAADHGLRLPLAEAAGDVLAQALDNGLGDRDIAALYLLYEGGREVSR